MNINAGSRPTRKWAGLPPQEIPKTVEAFRRFEEQYQRRVPDGLWYEVALARYLNEIAFTPNGPRVFLEAWGSAADNFRQQDALVCVPTFDCRAVDFTTNDRDKVNFTMLIDKRWFKGEGPTLEVDPEKFIWIGGSLNPKTGRWEGGNREQVRTRIVAVFQAWWKVAQKHMPKHPWPNGD